MNYLKDLPFELLLRLADSYRYRIEYSTREQLEISIENAISSYGIASSLAQDFLTPVDPLKLQLAMSSSTFYFKQLGFPYHTHHIAYSAFYNVMAGLHDVPSTDSLRHSTTAQNSQAAPKAEVSKPRPVLRSEVTDLDSMLFNLSQTIKIFQTEIVLRQRYHFQFNYFQEEKIIEKLRR